MRNRKHALRSPWTVGLIIFPAYQAVGNNMCRLFFAAGVCGGDGQGFQAWGAGSYVGQVVQTCSLLLKKNIAKINPVLDGNLFRQALEYGKEREKAQKLDSSLP